jgi:pilus assembly protein CpaF
VAATPTPKAVEPQRSNLVKAKALLQPIIDARIDRSTVSRVPRGDIAAEIKRIVIEVQQRGRLSLNVLEARDLVTLLVNEFVGSSGGASPQNQSSGQLGGPAPGTGFGAQPDDRQTLGETVTKEYDGASGTTSSTVEDAKAIVQPLLLERIDVSAATDLPRAELARQIGEIVAEIRDEKKLRFNLSEQRATSSPHSSTTCWGSVR